MFKIGEKVQFKRSDGSWSVGCVKQIINEYYIIHWLENKHDLVGERKVHMLHVKRCSRYRLFSFLFLVLIMLIDSFFYLKRVIFIILFEFISVQIMLSIKELEATASYFSSAHCGYIFWDLFYSRTERCSEMEKKKIVNINLLSLLLNYISQVLELVKKSFNQLDFSSKLSIIYGIVIFFLLLLIIFAMCIYKKRYQKAKKVKTPKRRANLDVIKIKALFDSFKIKD